MEDTLEQVVAAARAGSEEAQTELVRRFYPWAMNLAASYVDDSAAVSDVVQEAFVALLEGLDRLREPRAVPGFLRQILRRCAFRENKRRRSGCAMEESDGANALPSPSETLTQREAFKAVRQAVDSLPPATRKAVELFYLAELSCKEVSTRLGVPMGTVKRRLHDGRKRLRYSLIGLVRAEASSEDSLNADHRLRVSRKEPR